MATPQVENGHTRIANELLDVLMQLVIPPNQRQVLDCIMRKTWGFQKKVDRIANSQIAEATGLAQSTVCRCLKRLMEQKLIFRTNKMIGIQKDWEAWEVSSPVNPEKIDSAVNSTNEIDSTVNSEKLTDQSIGIDRTVKKSLTELSNTKEKKETIQKKVSGEFSNVFLTDEEMSKLIGRFGADGTAARIEKLSSYKASKGKRYKSDYATILTWERNDNAKNRDSRSLPKTYTPTRKYND